MKPTFIALLALFLCLAGCGTNDPELRSEKVITPGEAANKLFVEAVELVNEAKSKESTNLPSAIKTYVVALSKVRKIVSDYKESDIAVKLVSGETLFTGKSMAQINVHVKKLMAQWDNALVAAWEEAGFEVGWMGPHKISGNLYFSPNKNVFLPSKTTRAFQCRSSYGFEELKSLSTLPAPATAFSLSLSGRGGGVSEVVQLVSRFQNITALSLVDTSLDDEDLKEVAKLQELISLNLNYCRQVSDTGLKEVVKLQKLSLLRLDNTNVTDAGLNDVAKLQQLTLLSLPSQITDKGLEEVAKLQQLTSLNLSRCKQVTEEGLKEVAKLQKLERLFLAHTQVSHAGVKEVARLRKLKHLNMYGCKQITDTSLRHLVSLPILSSLDLSLTNITDAGLKDLAKLKNLTYLGLLSCKQVTRAGVIELQKKLPNCRIIVSRTIGN